MTAEDLENLSTIDSIAAHCPIMILSDRSGSMSGVDFHKINADLAELWDALKKEGDAEG